MREYLPKYLKNVVNPWSEGDASIVGIELRSSLSTRAPPNDQIKILHPKDLKGPTKISNFSFFNGKTCRIAT